MAKAEENLLLKKGSENVNQPKVICSFSGGKDSTAMVLRMIELGEHIDEVIFCDTYKEFPAMYRHVQKVRQVIEAAGIKFVELKNQHSYDYLMLEYRPKRRNKKNEQYSGYSWPGPLSRWCTTTLKTGVISSYIRQISAKDDICQCIGIAADEGYRLERPNNQQTNMRHPLVEWGWTEKECLQYCYSKGYDWEGLYEIFPRVSCWCCPLKSLEELRRLRKHFPDLWQELRAMDERTWRTFLKNYSVKDLETRFDLEEEFKAHGKSIRSKEFFAELKERLGK